MAKKTINQIKLGIFVMAGLAFLILILYMIGKNQNLFGRTFVLKARFDNVHGLMWGNNIRFAGIDAGTVKDITMINDTTIEVTLLIKTSMKRFIRKNAIAGISTDGLMGNRIVNITPSPEPSEPVEEGDILYSEQNPDPNEMLKVLDKTNNDLAIIASGLRTTVGRINESRAVWTILNDSSLPMNLRESFRKFKDASVEMDLLMSNLKDITSGIREGKGTAGELISDTVIAHDIKSAIASVKKVGTSADSLSRNIDNLINSVSKDINEGDGLVNGILKDRQMRNNLNQTIQNTEQATKAFNENMEALKHHWLFKGYFRKQEKNKP